jgi:hypothetical protein
MIWISLVLGLLVSALLCRWLGRDQPGGWLLLRVALGTSCLAAALIGALWLVPDYATLPAFLGGAALGTVAMQGAGLRDLTARLAASGLAIYLLSVATLAALVLLFVPIGTFLTSPGELGIHLDYLVANNAREAIKIFYVAAIAYLLAPNPRVRTALTLLSLGALSLALVYTYVLPFGYPMMSGLVFEQVSIDATARWFRTGVDLAVLVLVALGLRSGLRRFGGRPFVVGLLLLDAALCAAAGIDVHRERFGARGDAQVAESTERPLRFSRTRPNVLFIFLDRFMGSYVEEILAAEPLLAQRLSGFTWYPRTVSAGENSIAGVHGMLGGYDYTPDAMNARGGSLRDLSVEAFSILPYNFARQGWSVNVVGPRGLGFTMAGDCSFLRMERVNCTHIPKSVSKSAAQSMGFPLMDLAKSNYSDLLSMLGAMRSGPYAAKELLLHRGPWQNFLDHSAGTTFREWAELRGWSALTDTGATGSSMNFISSILPHEPYYMGDDCRPRRTRQLPGKEMLGRYGNTFAWIHAVTARCTLLAVADYLDYLKAQGVYDNTRILVVSDHGIVGPVTDLSSRAITGGTQAPEFVRTRSLLLVKPRGATGSLAVSEEFLPNAEAPHIACMELGGCVNPYLHDKPISPLDRTVPFQVTMVPWQFNLQKPDSFVVLERYSLEGGDPFNARGWKRLPAD